MDKWAWLREHRSSVSNDERVTCITSSHPLNSPVVCSSIGAINVNKCSNFELVLGRSSRLTCSQVIVAGMLSAPILGFSRVTNSLLAYFCHLSVYICTFSYKQMTNSTKIRPQTEICKQIKSSMASCAPNARMIRMIWIAMANARDQRSRLSGSMTNAKNIIRNAPSSMANAP